MRARHHDNSARRLTRLREQLLSELRSQTSEPFDIFMDEDDIGLGGRGPAGLTSVSRCDLSSNREVVSLEIDDLPD